jgi:hypothetical protein
MKMSTPIHWPSDRAICGVLNSRSGWPKKQAFSPPSGAVEALKAPAIFRLVAGVEGRKGARVGVGVDAVDGVVVGVS